MFARNQVYFAKFSLVALGFVCLNGSYADLKVGISPKKQEGNNCYGAVAQEILRLNGKSATQREISAITRKNNPFQGDDFKGADLKNSGGSPIDALRYYGLNSTSRGYYPDTVTVREVLGRGDALALSVGNSAGGHALLLFGITDDNTRFWIWDPASGAQHLMSMSEIERTWRGYNYYGWVDRPGGNVALPPEVQSRPSFQPPAPQQLSMPTPPSVVADPPRRQTNAVYNNTGVRSDPKMEDLLRRLDKLNRK